MNTTESYGLFVSDNGTENATVYRWMGPLEHLENNGGGYLPLYWIKRHHVLSIDTILTHLVRCTGPDAILVQFT